MAMLHVESWKAKDNPFAYDLLCYHIRQKVEVWLARKDGRFKLYAKAGNGKDLRMPVTLREGSYMQVDLIDIYLSLLTKAVEKAA